MQVIYTYARHEDESDLCALELRSLFGSMASIADGVVAWGSESEGSPSVNRSPFFKRRIEVIEEAESLSELTDRIASLEPVGGTFKVLYTEGDERHSYDERRMLERTAGSVLKGKAEMRQPEKLFGLIRYKGNWLFGPCQEDDSTWLKHQSKPQNYSTALPTRAARAIVNIGAGQSNLKTLRMIDPCCGMGTVLIEAMSMGIAIDGIDRNPLAVQGARLNLAHFGYPNTVKLGDMQDEMTRYDTAIVDMPYNLCSVLPQEESLAMLRAVRRIAGRAVIVTTEEIEERFKKAHFRLRDQVQLSKGSFTRYISVVE
ncbi:TRM11 family SAM-dependent methyltransferase [Paenibacillus paeoniae]|uniref:Methyltransferase domain-containing protein n=1 Tax=Paenibacillus paeoniae TaxID=2292705 RepID=A0A371P662_9BACL|nr:methyltransferase domain-containing protein [Paenibacillus paeoniae]REK71447.1 methyltransferase domain-containing protein [Paenibacillus paeoniae]